ncbi:PDDEXK nuclease domain-containing protein [Chryseobacterium salipaludis]|uniref:PDDEXK nuclease domain-containing protein n=1 Tax=Chryseobacterium TaxID=59732 RepID=UPI001FF450D2|nr:MULTISPECIES: PDDEXK nuclease domain-containing protein [Chryseobacterium]MCJ8498139.1 PDDEXK nuclease domain-containing protein [Chryseobacterium salipaludis]MCX3296663.1 PDDEXK nuclease domain-containing protein [Planobacterium sp. JC490]
MNLDKQPARYIADIQHIISEARQNAYASVASTMIQAYWKIGRRIVDEEQNGSERAEYGAMIIKNLAAVLGKGFSARTLRDCRQFYLTFSTGKELAQVCAKLNWSHARLLMRINNKEARAYYLKEATEQNWSVRTLERNISTLYYQRLLSSQQKDLVEQEMKENTGAQAERIDDFIKNPSVLEFLQLPTSYAYTEAQLEQKLIDNLQQFLLELGKGFAFVARQKHIRTETQDFFIDLVFYNYILKCFVIVELKTNKLSHQDIGQLDMYVRMFDDLERREGDNPTIGILLCTETDRTIAKYSVLKENKQLFTSKYLLYLPTEEELIQEIEREKQIIQQNLDEGREL